MIVKPSVSFLTTDSDSMLIADTNSIVQAMTGNTKYPSPSPTLAVVSTVLASFKTALAAAADGGKTLTSAKNDARANQVSRMRDLASYVQVQCGGDLTVLLSSGFPLQKPQRQPIGPLPAPANLTVVPGVISGTVNASASPVPGASAYNWRVATAAAPNVPVQTLQTTAASLVFTDLTPAVTYNVEVNALGSSGPSDWSDPASLIAV